MPRGRGVLFAVTVGLLVLVVAPPSSAQQIEIEYRAWAALGKAFELRYARPDGGGLRITGAHGADDCVTFEKIAHRLTDRPDLRGMIGACWTTTIVAIDIIRPLAERRQWYVGYQHIARSFAWSGGSESMFHAGLRLGLMGTVPLRPRLDLVYDAAVIPVSYGYPRGVSRPAQGVTYRLALQYTLAPSSAVEVGTWNFGYRLPDRSVHEGILGLGDHLWTGVYVAVRVRF